MTSGIRARLRSGHIKGSMLGSNVEETSKQTRGREMEHTARGRGRMDKSRDAFATILESSCGSRSWIIGNVEDEWKTWSEVLDHFRGVVGI